MKYADLTRSLLGWYDRQRRELPWRQETDPYRIWVSEIMLQQTRVEAVIPYYERFLQRFPDMRALAAASEEELMAIWQGLGYYSRARNLQQGVREVLTRYDGRTPESPAALLSLPGIGSYTAGAILSIAYNQPEPAIDGNVLRVFSRLLHIEEPIERPAVRRRIDAAVREMLLTGFRRGDVTQALMELGALVCIPGAPRCPACPWREVCIACKNQVQNSLPRKKASEPPRLVNVYTGILTAAGRVLAVKRPPRGLLAGMWEFPSAEVAATETVDGISLLQRRFLELGQHVAIGSEWRSLTHTFSHRQWRVRTFFCQALPGQGEDIGPACWLDRSQLLSLNWAGPYRQIAAQAGEELGKQSSEKGL